MRTTLSFENKDTKTLLVKLDFEFFLKQNIEANRYPKNEIDKVYSSFYETIKLIKIKAKADKRQFNYYTEGQVRKMFTGGFLPALFELDESRKHTILDFLAVGESWAYFNQWQNYQKQKITKEKIWDLVVKTGSILAILLSLLKLIEIINQ